jgi:uncharacterized protein YgbK (DUF1537 family)
MPAPFPFAAFADDFTGGADLASMIAGQGVSTVLVFGPRPAAFIASLHADALVACYKSRSVAPEAARAAARRAHAAIPARQWFFKYCSTFDSTPRGNIGPVLEEFLALTQSPFTIAVPALPINGRTQYHGHLFVNGVPLHESSLARHPLNPMSDANLPRWLARQTNLPIGLVPLLQVRQGPDAIRAAFSASPNTRVFFLDAIDDTDLVHIAAATHDLPLLSGGSGLGAMLPRHWPLSPPQAPATTRGLAPRALILSGSCSDATLGQLEALRLAGHPIHALSPSGYDESALQSDLAARHVAVLSSSSASPTPEAAEILEHLFGAVARRAVHDWQVERLIVAGGETSGAVVSALDIPAARLLSTIAPGVPALLALGERPLGLALKSGNFGGPDFFAAAQHHLAEIRL